MADTRLFVQGQDYFLAGAGITALASTINLTSFKTPDGTQITMSNFGTLGYATLEPETSREENISFTGVVANADGTTTLTGVVRGLGFVSPYTTVGALQLAHAGGTKLRITNSAPFYNEFANRLNDETITGVYTFTNPNVPRIDVEPSYLAGSELYFATKEYVDGVAIAGAPNASTTQKGIVQEATQAQVDARTTTGSTAARLFTNPGTQRSTLLSDYAADSVGTDAYAITITPAITAYVTGQTFVFKAGTTNTGAATLAVSGLAPITIKKNQTFDLSTGDIKQNQIVEVIYDGTNFQMISMLGKAQVSQDGSEIYAADSVGTDAYAVTLSPAITAYATGMVVNFKAGTINTGAATLAVNGLSAITIKKNKGDDLANGDIQANQVVTVIYDGTNFQMQSQIGNTNLSTFMQPRPLGHVYDVDNTTTYNSNTNAIITAVEIPFDISVAKITITVISATTPGTAKIALYSIDGQTKIFEVTTPSLTGAGNFSQTQTAVAVPRGLYYIAYVNVGTTVVDLLGADYLTIDPASEPGLCGNLTVTAGTLPSTFSPTAFTSARDKSPIVRFDN